MKGKTVQRGYGAQHRRLRAMWARQVMAGLVDCARCGRPIEPGALWDLDHTEARDGYNGPAHVYCNRSVAARKANSLRRRRRQFSRRW
jgi:hypothetical protein